MYILYVTDWPGSVNTAPKLVTVFPSLEIIAVFALARTVGFDALVGGKSPTWIVSFDEDKLTLKLLGSAVTVVSDLIFKLLEKAAKPNVIVPISAIKILNKSFSFV